MKSNEIGIGYKINTSQEYMVFKSESDGRTFYKVRLQRKNYDGTKEYAYKNVMFKKGVELQDRSIIKIKSGFEDFRINPNDKYNAIWSVFITDFEYAENVQRDEINALNEFEKNVKEAYKSPYDFENDDEYVQLLDPDNDID